MIRDQEAELLRQQFTMTHYIVSSKIFLAPYDLIR